MIAELFYPKELKEAIAELRAKDDLNEDALKAVRGSYIVFLLLWLIAVAIATYHLYPDIVKILAITIIGFGVVILMSCIDVYDYNRRMMAYLKGERRYGEVMEICYKARSPTAKIKLYDWCLGQSIEMGYFHHWYKKSKCPKKGEKISYYSLGSKRHQNMPVWPEIMNQYCLSKRLLEGESDA